ncbi:MAG: hypothetical protein QXN59_02365, partial [Candidatus Micrarchaeaceae archaeon]
ITFGVSSFNLSGIYSSDAKMVYIEELLSRVYGRMLVHGASNLPRLYIIIDEGRSMLDRSSAVGDMVNRIMEEGRKFGYGVILASHNASELSKQIVSNAGTFIAFRSKEPSDINYIAGIISGGNQNSDEIKYMLSRLEIGSAIVSAGGTCNPRVVRVPGKEIVNRQTSAYSPSLAGMLKKPQRIEELVSKYGERASSEIYSALNSRSAETYTFRNGNTEEVWVAKKGPQSAEHAVMVRKIFESVSASGVSCRILNRPGAPDLAVYYCGSRIAIEYETGKKKLDESKAMVSKRANEYDYVIVIVNDGHANPYFNMETETIRVMRSSEALNCNWVSLFDGLCLRPKEA